MDALILSLPSNNADINATPEVEIASIPQ